MCFTLVLNQRRSRWENISSNDSLECLREGANVRTSGANLELKIGPIIVVWGLQICTDHVRLQSAHASSDRTFSIFLGRERADRRAF